jgi:hypothetical protein
MKFTSVLKLVLLWVGIAIGFLAAGAIVLLALETILMLLGVQIQDVEFSYTFVLTVDAVILSLMFSRVPNLDLKFAALPDYVKVITNLLSVILVSLLMYGFNYWGLISISGLTYSYIGFVAFLKATVTAMVLNQFTDYATPDSARVKAFKETLKAVQPGA